MTGPVAFGEARLAELETAAKAAGGYRWESDDEALKADHGEHGVEQIGEFWKVPDNPNTGYVSDPESAAHAALHDPARALREVEAGRRILARHAECGSGTGYCDDGGHGNSGGDWGCADLADLLNRWADHPDYDKSWKP